MGRNATLAFFSYLSFRNIILKGDAFILDFMFKCSKSVKENFLSDTKNLNCPQRNKVSLETILIFLFNNFLLLLLSLNSKQFSKVTSKVKKSNLDNVTNFLFQDTTNLMS